MLNLIITHSAPGSRELPYLNDSKIKFLADPCEITIITRLVSLLGYNYAQFC